MAGKKKLVHLINLDGAGGGPKTVFSHVSYYSHFFDVYVLHGGEGYLARGCDSLNIPRTKIPLETPFRSIFGFFILIGHLLSKKPDILMLHGQWAGPLGAIAGTIARVPHMIYVCQWPSFYTDWDLFRVIRNYVVEWIPCRLSSKVITISPGNLYQYQIRFPKLHDRFVLFPNSLDPFDKPEPSEIEKVQSKEGWDSNHCHIVSVGRISTQKRLDWLLLAWKKVQSECPNARLWIIGRGELEQEIKNLAVDLSLTNICFLGPRTSARGHIAAADIVVMTSMYEGHANVPLEAMSLGRPLVANKVDGVKESYSNGIEGYLVQPGDSEALADRLICLIKDKSQREKMGALGLKRAEAFNRGAILKRYLALLNFLLENQTSQHPR